MHSTILWFRRDLRLDDNSAWNWALQRGLPIIPVYLHNPDEEKPWQRGAASNWWLHHALADLAGQLQELGLDLHIIPTSNSLDTLQQLITETNTSGIAWNRCYEPLSVTRDSAIKQSLTEQSIEVQSFNGSLLLDPLKLRNKAGKPFLVFTPFWKHSQSLHIDLPETTQGKPLHSKIPPQQTIKLSQLQLLPQIPWADGFTQAWNPSRQGALKHLDQAANKSEHYLSQRDLPSSDGTSQLSPYLHFGQISPREFHHHIHRHAPDTQKADTGILRQLYWREFSAHLLYHFPHSQNHALKKEYDLFPWEFDMTLLQAWQRGQTGFPIVDAGMRQLWHTGWMHNRVRMITASFLVKHLLQPWQEGARWFWETLVDADLANNSMGWQWIAGSGADASPYFRVFNPILQGTKFDPTGAYVKTWIPELAQVPAHFIHTPWKAEPLELAAADVTLGKTYPFPVISHQQGRVRALQAYSDFKTTRAR